MYELLAPVGNMDCLFAAINAGCDAVYLSGINFGARSFAGNFTNDELIVAINTCHLYGVKVYVTVNTLIYDVEVDRLMKYIDFLHRNNVDAVIMQDIGMIDLIRKTYPNLDIHVSTQAHIHNLEGVKFCEKLGLKRVVLARETNLDLIKKIKKETNIEIEVFVHGALCMSYSGQCLMSALIGSRSGNRGTCAQVCRKPYSLEVNNKIVEKDKYLLSCKDLCTLEYLDKILETGVKSLKIEGRMKRPEYVYLTVSIYRKAIDNYLKNGNTNISDEDIIELKKIFNRDFTKGFILNEDNNNFTNKFRPNHMGINIGKVINYKNGCVTIKLSNKLNKGDGIRIIGSSDTGLTTTSMYKNNKLVSYADKGDIITIKLNDKVYIGDKVLLTTDVNQIKNIQEKIKINKKIFITGKCIIKIGEPIILTVSDGINKVEVISDYKVESSKKAPITKEKIKEQLSKLGDSVYSFSDLNIECNNNIFIPIIVLNTLKREFVNLLNEKRLYKKQYKKCKYSVNIPDFERVNKTSILINNYQEYLKVRNNYDIIYIDNLEEYKKIDDSKCILKLPRVIENIKDYSCKLLVGELGSVYKYKNVDIDFSLNVFNSYSVAFLHSIGVNKITLSLELNYKQIKYLIEEYIKRYKVKPNLEVITSLNEEAMICKYNLLKNYNADSGYLIDEFNNKYKILIKNNLMYILNYKRRELKEHYFDIGVNYIRKNI